MDFFIGLACHFLSCYKIATNIAYFSFFQGNWVYMLSRRSTAFCFVLSMTFAYIIVVLMSECPISSLMVFIFASLVRSSVAKVCRAVCIPTTLSIPTCLATFWMLLFNALLDISGKTLSQPFFDPLCGSRFIAAEQSGMLVVFLVFFICFSIRTKYPSRIILFQISAIFYLKNVKMTLLSSP